MTARRWTRWVSVAAAFVGLPLLVAAVRMREFDRAGAFNVYTVAAERRPTLLTGGLRILPHDSLAELDAQLGGKPPAIVVVPNIPNIASAENKPLVEWMKRQAAAGSIMHSWCTGAMALAEAGLLQGRW